MTKAMVLTLMAAALLAGCSGNGSQGTLTGGGSSSGGVSSGSSGSGSSGSGGSSSSSSGGMASSSGSGGASGSSGSSSGGMASSSGSGGSSSGSGGGSGGGSGSGSGSGGSSSGSGSGSGSSSGGTDPIAAARAQCVQTINAYRATLSPPSPALTEATSQESCVDGQAMADEQSMTPHSAFGNCGESAQDECPGWPGPPAAIMGYMSMSCLDAMWAEGPPPAGQDNHWLNMSNAQYTQVACGFFQAPDGSWWATQDFY